MNRSSTSKGKHSPNLFAFNAPSMEPASYAEKVNTRGYVEHGEDNMFPEYLLSLYNNSALHHALCDGIAYMIHGTGYRPQDLQANLKYEEFSLDDELLKCALDFTIHGGFAIEVNWSLDRTRIDSVFHCPFENLRSGVADKDGVVEHYVYSNDWNDSTQKKHVIAAWNPERSVEEPRQVMYVKPFSAGSYYYPKPSYIGAINYIELDREIGLFHVNNIRNGLMPSFMINFKNGEPTAIERASIRAEIESQISGASNAGKWFMTFNDQPERAPDFIPFPTSDNDTKYQFLSELATEKIMMGHRVTNPMMFGLLVAGRLGGGTELAESRELFNEQVITPARRIFQRALKDLYAAMGLNVYWEMARATNIELSVTNWLIERGEVMDGYELVESTPVNYDTDDDLAIHLSLAAVIGDSGVDGSSEQDTELFQIRYRYRGMPATGRTRDFCRLMLSADRVYKKEDIVEASSMPVNAGFGEGGSSTYDVWLYKGGPRCGHFWQREVYLRSDQTSISVSKARSMISALPIDERKGAMWEQNNPKVSKHPNDMKHKGFHPDNLKMPKDAKAKTSGL